MKTLFISIVAVLIVAVFAIDSNAIDWKKTNQATVAWDAVSVLGDGTALPAGDVVKYRVYLANEKTDPDKANPSKLGETDLLQYTITLNTEGRFWVGVQSVRYDSAGVELEVSDINWSDTNGEYTPVPFGIFHHVPPGKPKNLR
jgi:hypothetical protein